VLCIAYTSIGTGNIHGTHYWVPDAQSYVNAGKYFWLQQKLHFFRTWGYPLIAGLPLVFTENENTARAFLILCNFIFFTGSVLLLFHIIQETANKILAWIGSILFLLSPGIVFIQFAVLTESLFIFISLLAIRYFQLYTRNAQPKYLVWFYLFICYAAAIRPIYFYLCIILLPWLFVIFYRRKFNWKFPTAIAGIFILFILLPMFAMKRSYGVFTFTHNSGYVLYHYIGSYAASIPGSTQIKMYDSFDKAEKALDARYGVQKTEDILWTKRDSLYRSEFKQLLRTKFKSFLVAYIFNLKENATSASHFLPLNAKSNKANHNLATLSKWENMAMSIIGFLLFPCFIFFGFVQVLRKKGNNLFREQNVFVAILGLVLMAFGALSFWQGDRFSIVYYPMVLILVAAVLQTFNKQKTAQL